MNVGYKIKMLRENNGLTQAEVAKENNISLQRYQRFEKGTFLPPLNVLIDILNFYGVKHFDIMENPESVCEYSVLTDGWVLISDRLPPDGEQVVLTIKNNSYPMFDDFIVVKGIYNQDSGFLVAESILTQAGYFTMYCFDKNNDEIIAWKPMIKPYIAKENIENELWI